MKDAQAYLTRTIMVNAGRYLNMYSDGTYRWEKHFGDRRIEVTVLTQWELTEALDRFVEHHPQHELEFHGKNKMNIQLALWPSFGKLVSYDELKDFWYHYHTELRNNKEVLALLYNAFAFINFSSWLVYL
jgi:hypothetical protein